MVGIGRMGGALAIGLARAGFSVETLVYGAARPGSHVLKAIGGDPQVISIEETTRLESDIVLLATQDTVLPRVGREIYSKASNKAVLLHTSGSLSSEDVFGPASVRGISAGSMHPLVSVSDPERGAEHFAGAYFCIEGSPQALDAATEIVTGLGGTRFLIETRHKPLYHASAVLASGHLVALLSAAVRTLTSCGVDEGEAKAALIPLVPSSVANFSSQETRASLTGPFARGDAAAVARHLTAFDSSSVPGEKGIYLELGLEALRLAEQAGIGRERIEEIRRVIMLARGPGK